MTSDELISTYYNLFRFGGHKEAIDRLREDLKKLEQEAYERGKCEGYPSYDYG